MKKVLIILMVLFVLNSCKDEPNFSENENNSFKNTLSLMLQGSVYNTFVDSIQGDIHAINVASIVSPLINYGVGQNSGNDISAVSSAYNINGSAGSVNLVKINNQSVSLMSNSFPTRYLSKWNGGGLSYGSNIIWEFHQDTCIVKDTIVMPNDFGTMSFSNTELNLSTGGTLYWGNTNSGDVILTVQYDVYDTTSHSVTESKIVKSLIVPNNGSYNFTSSQLLNDFDIPTNATKVGFNLVKANFKTEDYYGGTKQLLNIALVEQWFTIFVD